MFMQITSSLAKQYVPVHESQLFPPLKESGDGYQFLSNKEA